MWKLLTHNWNLKLTALVLAIVLWSHVRGEVNPLETGVFRVPLKASLPREMLITQGKVPTWVQVTLRAPRQVLRDLRETSADAATTLPNPLAPAPATTLRNDDVRARLDFSGGNVTAPLLGEVNVPVRAECRLPDTQVMSTEPGSVALTLDRAAHVVRPIRAQMADTPDFVVRVKSLSPAQVTLYGPAETLKRVARVVAPLDLASSVGEQNVAALLRPVDERGRPVDGVVIEPPTARVQFSVSERIVSKTLRLVLRAQGLPATGFRVMETRVIPARITVRGPRRVVDQLESLPLALDVTEAKAVIQRRVKLILPANVELADEKAHPTVEARVRLEEVKPATSDAAQTAAPMATSEDDAPLSLPSEGRGEHGAGLATPSARNRSEVTTPTKLPPPASG